MLSDYHPVVKTIIDILHTHGVWHETFEHAPVTTSEEAAKIRDGYTLSQGAKALIIVTEMKKENAPHDKASCMFVLPADKKLDNKKVRQILSTRSFRFADRDELAGITSGVERGGVPPWGHLFHIPMYVDEGLFHHEKIVFNAGDRRFSIAMRSADYRAIVQPHVVVCAAEKIENNA